MRCLLLLSPLLQSAFSLGDPDYVWRDADKPVKLYLRLLRDTVAGIALGERERSLIDIGDGILESRPLDLVLRDEGRDWPWMGTASIGLRALDLLQEAVQTATKSGVIGDFVDAGVWRGGTTAVLFGTLLTTNDTRRKVHVFDQFHSPYPPSLASRMRQLLLPGQASESLSRHSLASMEEVKANLYWTNLLDEERIIFSPGPYQVSLPPFSASSKPIAILKLAPTDEESGTILLKALYPKTSLGAFIIVDNMNIPGVRGALDAFRASYIVHEKLQRLTHRVSYWIRESKPESEPESKIDAELGSPLPQHPGHL